MYQPLPLNFRAAGDINRSTSPPHWSCIFSGESENFWITSNFSPQEWHLYSYKGILQPTPILILAGSVQRPSWRMGCCGMAVHDWLATLGNLFLVLSLLVASVRRGTAWGIFSERIWGGAVWQNLPPRTAKSAIAACEMPCQPFPK